MLRCVLIYFRSNLENYAERKCIVSINLIVLLTLLGSSPIFIPCGLTFMVFFDLFGVILYVITLSIRLSSVTLFFGNRFLTLYWEKAQIFGLDENRFLPLYMYLQRTVVPVIFHCNNNALHFSVCFNTVIFSVEYVEEMPYLLN